MYRACRVANIRADSVWVVRFWPGLRNNRRNPDDLKKKTRRSGPSKRLNCKSSDLRIPLLQNPAADARVFAAVLCGLNAADVLPSSYEKSILVHTDRIHINTQAPQAFPPDSRRRRPSRHTSFAVARLLPCDSCYTLFQWPIRFRNRPFLCSQLSEGIPMT